ncbi:histidine triad nucleotide-binding protein [Guggenheimella bovis]
MLDLNCIFCKIIEGTIPSEKVFENDAVLAIKDIEPTAPIHYLVIPKTHVRRMSEADPKTIQSLFEAVKEIAKTEGLEEKGYRLVINTGEEGGQTVDHLHIHLIAGRPLTWPAG